MTLLNCTVLVCVPHSWGEYLPVAQSFKLIRTTVYLVYYTIEAICFRTASGLNYNTES